MSMIIRPATKKDLPVLLEFEQEIIATEQPIDPTLIDDDEIHYYDIAEYIKSPTTEVVVAVVENEVVGSAYGQIQERKPYFKQSLMGHIGFVYVKPDHRGQGVSQTLLQVLCDWFKVRSIEEVRLNVYQNNERAIRAYEKAGFTRHMVEMRMQSDD